MEEENEENVLVHTPSASQVPDDAEDVVSEHEKTVGVAFESEPETKEFHSNTSVASTPTQKPKEPEVLTDNSLQNLARYVGQERLNGLIFPMMLNMPTTSVVHCIHEVTEKGFQNATDSQKNAVYDKCILLWKRCTAELKSRDRVRALERALREMGRNEVAEMVVEKHQNKEEITPEALNQLAQATDDQMY